MRQATAGTSYPFFMSSCHPGKYGLLGVVKTTIEFPDELFRAVKAKAAQDGISLKEYVTAALQEKLGRGSDHLAAKPWMKHFGSVAHLREETRAIERTIENEFETIEADDWQ